MWPIYTGVLIAILALQQIAPHAVNLLKKYPILEPTAFVLIGYVGVLLISEETYHLVTGAPVHLPAYFKFVGILFIIFVALLYDVRSHGSPAGDAAGPPRRPGHAWHRRRGGDRAVAADAAVRIRHRWRSAVVSRTRATARAAVTQRT